MPKNPKIEDLPEELESPSPTGSEERSEPSHSPASPPKRPRGRPIGSTKDKSPEDSKKADSRRIRKIIKEREVNPGDENFAHMFVAPLAGIGASQIDTRFQPTPQEIDDILRPLERIAIRRLPVDVRNQAFHELDPDKKDVALAAGGVLAYATRVFTNPSSSSSRGPIAEPSRSSRKRSSKAERGTSGGTEESTSTSVPGNGAVAGSTVDDHGIAHVESISEIDTQTYARSIMQDLWNEMPKANES